MTGENKKSVRELWQDYRFLTKEMIKFLTKLNMDLFYELMNQRERLQAIIEQTADDGFKASPEGRSLLAEIQEDNQFMIENLQLRRNSIKRHHQVSEAYNGVSNAPVSRMNWKR